MKNNKLILMAISLTLMCLIPVAPVNAINEVDNNSFYVEKGQINLKDLEICLDNQTGEIAIKEKKHSTNASIEKVRLVNHLNDSPELKNVFKNSLENDISLPQAVGYSKIYFETKEKKDDDIFDQEPMTIDEYESAPSRVAGSTTKSPGGNFTLYTNVYKESYDNSYYFQSIGNYAKTSVGVSESPSSVYYDYITLTIPSAYTLTNPTLLSPSVNSYREHEQNNGVGYKVRLGSYKNVILSGKKLSTSSVGVKKTISHYMHTWGTVNVSFSVTPTAIGFNISSGTAYWQLASSVTTSC